MVYSTAKVKPDRYVSRRNLKHQTSTANEMVRTRAQSDNNDSEDDCFDDDSDSDYTNFSNSNSKKKKKSSGIPRLCDGSNSYYYYMHYRDFNRRMVEWITSDCIVAPPSVEISKAKARTKKEKNKKRCKEEDHQRRVQSVENSAEQNNNINNNNNHKNNNTGEELASTSQRLTRR